jgi:hypothetical protein
MAVRKRSVPDLWAQVRLSRADWHAHPSHMEERSCLGTVGCFEGRIGSLHRAEGKVGGQGVAAVARIHEEGCLSCSFRILSLRIHVHSYVGHMADSPPVMSMKVAHSHWGVWEAVDLSFVAEVCAATRHPFRANKGSGRPTIMCGRVAIRSSVGEDRWSGCIGQGVLVWEAPATQ